MHNELVVEFKDGSREWIVPVYNVSEDDHMIYVEKGSYCPYEFEKVNIDKWIVRPYDPETTYDWIGLEKPKNDQIPSLPKVFLLEPLPSGKLLA